MEYTLEYSGLPNQCGTCRSLEHQVCHCPKQDGKFKRREAQPNHKPVQQYRKKTKLPKEALPTAPASTSTDLPIHAHNMDNTTARGSGLPVEIERPNTPTTPPFKSSPSTDTLPATLQLDEIIFPRLPSPSPSPQHTPLPPIGAGPSFVWRMKDPATTNKEKEKLGGLPKKGIESTPITRQGYRSGRLAEDFWTAIGMPNTPASPMKTLKVIAVVTKSIPPFNFVLARVE